MTVPASTADLARAAVARMREAVPDGQVRMLLDRALAQAVSRPLTPNRLPVLDWLGALPALACPATLPLVEALVAAAPELAWRQTYRSDQISARFLARYGWCELVGPHGGCGSELVRLGLLLLGPETEYPAHRHAAEEIYLVLAGTAAWRQGAAAWRLVPPADAVHHAPWVMHAARTQAEPLLALYFWWGHELTVPAQLASGTG